MADFPVGVITDEFTQDFDLICRTAVELGVPELEVRTIWDKNIVDMSDDEIGRVKSISDEHGRRVISVASPVYKCTLPGGGDIDERFEQDAFQAAHSFEDQPRILARALEIANRLGAPIVRVFSFWRTVDPTSNFDRIIELLSEAGVAAKSAGIILGLENEHACNFATGAETGRAIKQLDPEAFGVVWDPANAYVAGETPFPDGYSHVPAERICHVHAKDGVMKTETDRMAWGDVGSGNVRWEDQLAALVADGYKGSVSLETHWGGPGGDKFAGSTICAKSLKRLVAAA